MELEDDADPLHCFKQKNIRVNVAYGLVCRHYDYLYIK
jgi:hypothetical protein